MQDLKVALIQTKLFWEDRDQNLAHLEPKIADYSNRCDLVVLPEMFNSGFTMNTEKCAELMDGITIKWMLDQARIHQFSLVGSLIISEEDKFYNRCICAMPDGTIHHYDKRHLFRMGNEHLHFSAGAEPISVHIKGWKIGLYVCYDLRFPVWSRNTNRNDILIYVANWPQKRVKHWQKLLQARAIENQCYVLAVNRVGDDGNNTAHNGSSGIINFQGEWLQQVMDEEKVITGVLNYDELQNYLSSFPAWEDSDDFEIF